MVNTPFIPSRRAFIGAALSLAAVGGKASAGRVGMRLAAVDWAMLETAVALGCPPVAACELMRYAGDAGLPPLPAGTTDLGLRGSPNFELLALTRPDLILSSNYYTYIQPRLEKIAPVLSHSFYVTGEGPWPKALSGMDVLGQAVDAAERARTVKSDAEARLAQITQALRPMADRPVYVIQIGDPRHFRAFGADSMFGDVLTRLGLENAWDRGTRFSFAAPVPLEALAARPEARILTVGGVPPLARRGLERSALWNRLEPMRDGRVHHLAAVNPFGGVPSGLRFAELAAQALTGGAA